METPFVRTRRVRTAAAVSAGVPILYAHGLLGARSRRSLEAQPLVGAQVHVHRLHRGTAGTLAEVVQPRDQQGLVSASKYEDVHAIRVVARLDVEAPDGVRIAKRHDAH